MRRRRRKKKELQVKEMNNNNNIGAVTTTVALTSSKIRLTWKTNNRKTSNAGKRWRRKEEQWEERYWRERKRKRMGRLSRIDTLLLKLDVMNINCVNMKLNWRRWRGRNEGGEKKIYQSFWSEAAEGDKEDEGKEQEKYEKKE